MKNYEISFIVRPDLEKDAVEKLAKSYEKVLVDHKAKVLSSKELG
jgi:ribosomal protein S6